MIYKPGKLYRSTPGHLRIAFVITRSDTIGGAHIHVRDLAIALKRAGHHVRVLVGGGGMYVKHLEEKGLETVSVPSLVRQLSLVEDLRAMRHLRWHLQQFRPNLVSTHSSKAGWLGRVVAHQLGIPVLFTAHGWSFTAGVPQPLRTVYGVAEMVAANFTHAIVTVSDFDRELALRWKVAPPEKLNTVHNGVPDVASSLVASPARTPPTIAMVARLDAPKDHPTLFRALSHLTYRPFRVVLIGDGPYEADLRRLAASLGIADRVAFLGLQTDVQRHLASAQIFALVSKWEGFPRSVLEAMRAGLPVVGSRVGGISESVLDGETGFLCPRGDVQTLRDRLEWLLDDPSLRTNMGRAGRNRYVEHFTFDRLLGETMAVYQAILGADAAQGA